MCRFNKLFNNKRSQQQGFTLVEIMIVIAIISILVAVALPTYRHIVITANEHACLSEAKVYSNVVFYSLYGENQVMDVIPTPTLSACTKITDASLWTTSTASIIYAQPKNSQKQIFCDISQGTPCYITP